MSSQTQFYQFHVTAMRLVGFRFKRELVGVTELCWIFPIFGCAFVSLDLVARALFLPLLIPCEMHLVPNFKMGDIRGIRFSCPTPGHFIFFVYPILQVIFKTFQFLLRIYNPWNRCEYWFAFFCFFFFNLWGQHVPFEAGIMIKLRSQAKKKRRRKWAKQVGSFEWWSIESSLIYQDAHD